MYANMVTAKDLHISVHYSQTLGLMLPARLLAGHISMTGFCLLVMIDSLLPSMMFIPYVRILGFNMGICDARKYAQNKQGPFPYGNDHLLLTRNK